MFLLFSDSSIQICRVRFFKHFVICLNLPGHTHFIDPEVRFEKHQLHSVDALSLVCPSFAEDVVTIGYHFRHFVRSFPLESFKLLLTTRRVLYGV